MYALREIEAGEEIEASYIPLLKSWKERQARLNQYGFACGCEVCAKEGKEREDSDKVRRRIGEGLEELRGKVEREAWKKEALERLVGKAELLVKRVQEEGLVEYEAEALVLVRAFCMKAGRWDEAVEWARREEVVRALAGVESEGLREVRGFLGEMEAKEKEKS